MNNFENNFIYENSLLIFKINFLINFQRWTDDNKINDIMDTVNSNFSDRDKIEYIEIRKAVKANKGWSPTIDEISMTYCDSNEYCILNTKNKYVIARYDDTNRETLRKAHTKLIEKYKQMKNDLLNGSSQNDTQQNDSQNGSSNDVSPSSSPDDASEVVVPRADVVFTVVVFSVDAAIEAVLTAGFPLSVTSTS